MPNILAIFIPFALAFFVGIFMTPFLTHFLYSRTMWKKKAGKRALNGDDTPIFNSLHKDKEVGTPKMGGIVIWGSALAVAAMLWLASFFFPNSLAFVELNFISRAQTWLPIFALAVGGLIGLVDDFFEVMGNGDHIAGGLSLAKRLLVVCAVACLGAWWFYEKLGVNLIAVPFAGTINLGLFFIPFFIAVVLAVYASGVIDGIDGLAGGVFASVFFAYSVIAFSEGLFDLAALCAAIVGGLLAFLWFNIPPARFYMSETGTMGLTITLAIIAFLTDAHAGGRGVLVLPIIAFPLFLTLLSVIIQVFSKKFRNGKKVFLVAPIHHHFEALGWPAHKVAMRYWVVSAVSVVIGLALSLFGI